MSDQITPSGKSRYVFEEAFSLYAKGLLVYAQEFLSSREEAEDVVSDIFINLWEKIEGIAADGIKPYLFNSTRNRCLNHLSHLKVRSEYQQKILRDKDVMYPSPDLFVEHELRNYLNTAIDKLPARKKKIFIMHKMEKKSYKEIADELAISPKTVDNHLQAAIKMLREYIPKDIFVLMIVTGIFDSLH